MNIKTDKMLLLEDLKSANGEASLIRKAYNEETWEEFEKCTFAFFPGCKLTASEPELVMKIYDSILPQNPDTGIFLYCCGMPAKFEGDDVLLENTLAEVRSGWENLGKPTLIMACLGCYNLFKANLPEIPMVTVFKFLDDMGLDGGVNSNDYFIKYPAGTDVANETAAIMKKTAENMGIKLHEESEDGDYPYLVGSIKDRDALKRQGKDAVHILELLYDEDASENTGCGSACTSCGGCNTLNILASLPNDEEKHQNRLDLKQAMLEVFFNEF